MNANSAAEIELYRKDEEDGIVELSYLPLVRECNGYAHLTLSDLVYVKTLGAGGFGRVDLVSEFYLAICMK